MNKGAKHSIGRQTPEGGVESLRSRVTCSPHSSKLIKQKRDILSMSRSKERMRALGVVSMKAFQVRIQTKSIR